VVGRRSVKDPKDSKDLKGRRIDAWLAFGVGLLVRLAVVAWATGRFPAADDGHYYDILARRVAAGDGYTWLWPDGAVTYVAHYPVGYPALVAAAYAIFGSSPAVAMSLNALVGAAAAPAVHRLVDADGAPRWRAMGAALAVALHPALVPYTAALMTEGVTAALLVIACALVARARASMSARASWAWLCGAGVLMGVATLVRPQSLILAPVVGFLGAAAQAPWRMRTWRAAAVAAIALACVGPWTARNCVRMHRCALVSVNGGWNLLIGATTTTGGWHELAVPAACATVWDEAGKDTCFGRAAWLEIGRSPAAWLRRAPAKVAMTLDSFGAAPSYLHSSNPAAFDDRAKLALVGVETLACRVLLLAALVAVGRLDGAMPLARKWVSLAGAAAALTLHAWVGYLAIPVCVVLAGWRAIEEAPLVVPFSAAAIVATVAIHAVFFGAGRYGLVVAPLVAALGFAGRPTRAASSRAKVLDVDAARAVVRCAPAQWEESPSSTEHDAG
jgi:4-amino-4-deoxy-L-arabinose transferase-like glycosyltransferase